jgi:hypothetical protein
MNYYFGLNCTAFELSGILNCPGIYAGGKIEKNINGL